MSLSETDLDLIADYVEGLLDADQAAGVTARIANDPEWALTHRLLTGEDTRLKAALSGYARTTPPIPAEVSARIDDALANERAGANPDLVRSAAHGTTPVSTPIDLEAARQRRRPRRAWVGLSAAAAVVVALVFGLTALGLNLTDHGGEQSSTTSGAAPDAAGPASDRLSGVVITSTGVNYSPATLAKAAVQPHAMSTQSPNRGVAPNASTPGGPIVAPSPLQRLTDHAALAACISAVTAAHPGTVTAVEFARYQGLPALIITLDDPASRVAVGDQCGLPGAGANELASAPIR